MNPPIHSTPSPGLALGDILFIVFRHKWKILIISTLGILGAAALYHFGPVPYQSEAKLFIKYVVDTRAPAQGTANDPKIQMPSERNGENVINTEVEILTSLDLAQQAAAALPPEVLVKLAGGTNLDKAAVVIKKCLLPEVGKQSDVIHVIFQHKDPDVVQPVLKEIIATYFLRHAEIHRSLGLYDEYLTKQRDQLKASLTATENELRKAKEKAGIISIEDSKKYYSEQMARLQQAKMDTDAQLAERQAEVSAMKGLLPGNPSLAAGSPVASNLAAAAYPAPVATEKVDEYRRVNSLLESLSKEEQGLLMQFKPETTMVKGVRARIAANEEAKKKLEDENPGLLAVRSPEPRIFSSGSDRIESTAASIAEMNLIGEMAKIPGLESRLRVLTNQLENIRREAAVVTDAEGAITELGRQRNLEETNYNYFQKSLESRRADEQLGAASRNSNIIPIQTPSPPVRATSKLLKVVAMLLFGSIAGAFGLAFALEFYLDPSIKRATEVESRLHLPLFLSIPRLHLNGKASRQALGAGRTALLPEKTADSAAPGLDVSTSPPATGTALPILAWDSRHSLRPFQDALRDRLITYFDLKNLTHKPKMVALTSCGEGSGVTTIAAGLAASLSETGEGNVLLVNMNEQGSAHQFYRGNPACGLEDALELERRDTALVQEKLYVVRENQNGDQLPRSLPKQFQHLVPKLRASDYDYIIFDMPPISQVSVTSRLARYMDIALVVVEAEETDREVVKRAGSFLAQSGANVGVVLNKTRAYGPKRLRQDL
jgi:uncharacterized protein involved in exopolysaccharide biosynthesis/Mrp family chromosome partitioning ATPase